MALAGCGLARTMSVLKGRGGGEASPGELAVALLEGPGCACIVFEEKNDCILAPECRSQRPSSPSPSRLSPTAGVARRRSIVMPAKSRC